MFSERETGPLQPDTADCPVTDRSQSSARQAISGIPYSRITRQTDISVCLVVVNAGMKQGQS